MLSSLGTYSAVLTGKIDQNTKSSIIAAQSMLGLDTSGVINHEFITALKNGLILEPKALDTAKPLNEVFTDEYLAIAVRNSLGLVSISQKVDQSTLDGVTVIRIDDGPVKSLKGIEYLRNLRKFVAECRANMHWSNRDTSGPCDSAALQVASIRPLMACKHLEFISIHGAPFATIPYEIGDLINLETLVVEYGCFTTVPQEICKCEKLHVLAFEKTPITVLPEDIGNLSNITQLRLQGTRISYLPESIGKITGLTSLLCENSDFVTLPDSIGNLVNLTTLNLSGNIYLSTLPDSMENLTKINNLNLSYCKKLLSLPSGLQEVLVKNGANVNLEKTSIK